MKNNKGVTLSSLTIYIIVLMVIIVALTFISSNFTGQISDVTGRGKLSNESVKLYSYLINDVKSASKVLEFSDNYVRFDNDVRYSVKYLEALSDKEREKSQYEIYRNDVLISDNIMNVQFDYDIEGDIHLLRVKLDYIYGSVLVNKEQEFVVGRGYQ